MGAAITDESIRSIFEKTSDFKARQLRCGDVTLFAYFIDGLISSVSASEYVFRPIAQSLRGNTPEDLYRNAYAGSIYNCVAVPCESPWEAAQLLVNGFCVVLFPGAGALAFEVRSGDKRNPSPPEVENTVKGPKDAFVETLRTNTSLVRRHLRTPQLRFWEKTVGRRSLTRISVAWVEDITDDALVKKMIERVSEIDIDGVLSSSAVEEYVTGSRATPFPLLQYTERSDTFCKGLLDGRVGLLVDGLPLGYLAPVDLGYLMDSPEDRSRDYISATCVKLLRYGAAFMDLLLPGLYVAFSKFHPHLLPAGFRETVMSGLKEIPFAPGADALIMLVAFELLQESGIHLPQAIGQSVSTIGGIVVGTAAVEAGLISPIALIAVSVAGICGFVLPNRDLANALRFCRFALVLLAAAVGLPGIGIGVAAVVLHLISLKSMGVPYIRIGKNDIVRKRLKNQKYRNRELNPKDRKNQK